MPDDHQYGRWSKEELCRAEATASEFLEENRVRIAETLRTKVRFLEKLFERLSEKNASYEDRLESFARIGEIARLIQDDADGFFELASQPVIARLLGTVPHE
jgi:hypothetical protein